MDSLSGWSLQECHHLAFTLDLDFSSALPLQLLVCRKLVEHVLSDLNHLRKPSGFHPCSSVDNVPKQASETHGYFSFQMYAVRALHVLSSSDGTLLLMFNVNS